jgi:epoxide hydrolase-like predicted phosphatase
MTIRAIYFDFGGVLARTEDRAPRTKLAESLGLTYPEIGKIVFENESSLKASVGAITEELHWQNVVRSLSLPESEIPSLRDEFFRGDRTDRDMLDYLRGLRKTVKVGLISNAWSGLRAWIVSQKFDDAFDDMVVSAEVGLMKPDPRIYQLALEKFGAAPQEAVFLDDFIENVEGARAVGMQAIHFTEPEKALEELKQLLANHR